MWSHYSRSGAINAVPQQREKRVRVRSMAGYYNYWYSPQQVVDYLHAGTLASAPRVLVNGQCWVYTLKTKDDQAVGEQDDLLFIGRPDERHEQISACPQPR